MTDNLPAIIELPDDENLGEAMRALKARSPLMARFAMAKVEYACSNVEAARIAGYASTSRHSLESTGHRVAHDPQVADAIAELSRTVLRIHGPKSLSVMVGIMSDTKVKAETRLKAAVEVANRAGLHAVTEGKLTVEHKLSEAQMDERILALAAELNIPRPIAEKMLIDPSRVVDAEFVVVEPATPEQKAEQAQRDHANGLRRERRQAVKDGTLEDHKAEQRRLKSERGKLRYAEAQGAVVDDETWAIYPGEFENET